MSDTPKRNNSSISGSFIPTFPRRWREPCTHRACWEFHTVKAVSQEQALSIQPSRTFTCALITYDDDKSYIVHESADAPVALRVVPNQQNDHYNLEFYVNKDVDLDEATAITNFIHLLEEVSLHKLSYDVFGVKDSDLKHVSFYHPLVDGWITAHRADNVYQEAAIEAKYLRKGADTTVIETATDVNCDYPVFLVVREQQSTDDIQIRRHSLSSYEKILNPTAMLEHLKANLSQK